MNCGIYKIVNLVNGKIYFGCGDIEDRIYKHTHYLSKNEHVNDHLQNAWNKYGKDNFKFEVVCYSDRDYAKELEKRLIEEYNTEDPSNGYNKTEGGFSETHTEETKNKISKSKEGELTKEDNPHWKGGKTEYSCNICGEPFESYHDRQYCSIGCSTTAFEGYEHDEETREKIKKNRPEMLGSEVANSELNEESVKVIKYFIQNTERTLQEISDKYNVSRSTISAIKHERNWSHITL